MLIAIQLSKDRKLPTAKLHLEHEMYFTMLQAASGYLERQGIAACSMPLQVKVKDVADIPIIQDNYWHALLCRWREVSRKLYQVSVCP